MKFLGGLDTLKVGTRPFGRDAPCQIKMCTQSDPQNILKGVNEIQDYLCSQKEPPKILQFGCYINK